MPENGSFKMNVGITYNSFAYKDLLPEEKEMRDTGLAIGRHLASFGHNVQYFDMDDPLSIDQLCAGPVDVAFNACERIHDDARGEAYAAALLEYLGIPHTRTSSWLISLGISKERVKSILSYYQISTPRFQVFRSGQEPVDPGLHYPLFVKGLASENSIGIDQHSLVHNEQELRAKVGQIAAQLHQPALVEEYIDGREVSVAILPGLKNQVLPVSEIVFRDLPPEHRFLDYNAKWVAASERYQKNTAVCPAHLTDQERRDLSETALRCFDVLGLNSYARIDIRYREHTSYVLEVNQNPSISEEDSGYVRACAAYGLDYLAMLHGLLQNAIVRKSENLPARIAGPERGCLSQDSTDLFKLETSRL
jgi:D-alanine-D-alanine ligase